MVQARKYCMKISGNGLATLDNYPFFYVAFFSSVSVLSRSRLYRLYSLLSPTAPLSATIVAECLHSRPSYHIPPSCEHNNPPRPRKDVSAVDSVTQTSIVYITLFESSSRGRPTPDPSLWEGRSSSPCHTKGVARAHYRSDETEDTRETPISDMEKVV